MTRLRVTGVIGLPMALMGLAQTLQYASLIDSPYVAATLVLPAEGLEGLFAASMVFLLGTLLLAEALTPEPTP